MTLDPFPKLPNSRIRVVVWELMMQGFHGSLHRPGTGKQIPQ